MESENPVVKGSLVLDSSLIASGSSLNESLLVSHVFGVPNGEYDVFKVASALPSLPAMDSRYDAPITEVSELSDLSGFSYFSSIGDDSEDGGLYRELLPVASFEFENGE